MMSRKKATRGLVALIVVAVAVICRFAARDRNLLYLSERVPAVSLPKGTYIPGTGWTSDREVTLVLDIPSHPWGTFAGAMETLDVDTVTGAHKRTKWNPIAQFKQDPGLDICPAVSPRGDHILYLNWNEPTEYYDFEVGGTDHRKTMIHGGGRPTWSSDGSGWAVISDDGFVTYDCRTRKASRFVINHPDMARTALYDNRKDIVVYESIDNSNDLFEVRLTSKPTVRQLSIALPEHSEIYDRALSPDGMSVAWLIAIKDERPTWRKRIERLGGLLREKYPDGYACRGLWISRLDGTNMREIGRLSSADSESLSEVQWARDGKHLSFTCNNGLYIVRAN